MNSSFDPQYRVWFLAADNRDLVVSALSNHSVPAFVDEPDFGWVQVLPSAEGTTIIRDLSESFATAIEIFCSEEGYGFSIYSEGIRKSAYLAGEDFENPVADVTPINFPFIQSLSGMADLDVASLRPGKSGPSLRLKEIQLAHLYSFLVTVDADEDDYLDGGPNELLADLLGLGELNGNLFEDYWVAYKDDPAAFADFYPNLLYVGSVVPV